LGVKPNKRGPNQIYNPAPPQTNQTKGDITKRIGPKKPITNRAKKSGPKNIKNSKIEGKKIIKKIVENKEIKLNKNIHQLRRFRF
jgi:hypothetical protein